MKLNQGPRPSHQGYFFMLRNTVLSMKKYGIHFHQLCAAAHSLFCIIYLLLLFQALNHKKESTVLWNNIQEQKSNRIPSAFSLLRQQATTLFVLLQNNIETWACSSSRKEPTIHKESKNENEQRHLFQWDYCWFECHLGLWNLCRCQQYQMVVRILFIFKVDENSRFDQLNVFIKVINKV